MPEEKPLQKEIDDLLKAMSAVAPTQPTTVPAIDTGAPTRRIESRGMVATLDLLKDVALKVRIELGRSRMTVEDLLRLGAGSVVELDRLVGEPVDLYVNDRLAARGDLIVVDDHIAVRVTELISLAGTAEK